MIHHVRSFQRAAFALVLGAALLAGCRSVQGAPSAPSLQPAVLARTATPAAPLPTAKPPVPPPTSAPPAPTRPPQTATAAGPTAAPDPFEGWRIDDLAAREYGGSGIVLGEVVAEEFSFTQYAMSYESDGLVITGLANIPTGSGPFPAIIVNHGYGPLELYYPGYDSRDVAAGLARRGYLTLMPDYRNYGGSDEGPNPFRIGYALDVMNLVGQVGSLPQADAERIGIIGHSMGGGISTWPMVLQGDSVDAVVLYAAMSGDIGVSWEHIRRMWNWDQTEEQAEVYGTPAENPAGYAAASPTSYLDRVEMPVMIHHGTADDQVPFEWSFELWADLRAADKYVVFYEYEGEGHTFAGDTFVQFMTRNIAFFDRYVRDGEEPPPG